MKKESDILHPSQVALLSEWSINWYYGNTKPFEAMYWHHPNALGWGSVLFVDNHIAYVQGTYNQPSFVTCSTWSFVYNY